MYFIHGQVKMRRERKQPLSLGRGEKSSRGSVDGDVVRFVISAAWYKGGKPGRPVAIPRVELVSRQPEAHTSILGYWDVVKEDWRTKDVNGRQIRRIQAVAPQSITSQHSCPSIPSVSHPLTPTAHSALTDEILVRASSKEMPRQRVDQEEY